MEFYEKDIAVKHRIRRPKASKLLDDFQQQHRHEVPISNKEQLKESETNLEQIKKNNKRKFVYEVIDTRSKRASTSKYITETSFTDNSPKSRNRFLSLKTGLPDK